MLLMVILILFGHEWITQFAQETNFVELFSNKIHALITVMPCLSLNQKQQIDQLFSIYKDFSDVAGTFKGPPATIHLKLGVINICSCMRSAISIMWRLRKRSQNFVETLREDATLQMSVINARCCEEKWEASHHCNYKPILNPRMSVTELPIPKIEHLSSWMKDAKLFVIWILPMHTRIYQWTKNSRKR